jgi:hypothetical protein
VWVRADRGGRGRVWPPTNTNASLLFVVAPIRSGHAAAAVLFHPGVKTDRFHLRGLCLLPSDSGVGVS